jgi:hypothetical protein
MFLVRPRLPDNVGACCPSAEALRLIQHAIEVVVLRRHTTRYHLLDFLFRHIGHRPAAPPERPEALQLLVLDGGHEIAGSPSMAVHGDRLPLGDFSIPAKLRVNSVAGTSRMAFSINAALYAF